MSEINFKEIQVRRKEEKSHLPVQVRDAAKRKIGSHLAGRRPLSGLTYDEELKYLPRLIPKSSPKADDWDEKVGEFWADLFLDVPSGGVVLNISTRDGEPVVLEDWVKWKWLLKHKQVAKDEETMKTNPNKKFYIYDPEVVDKKTNSKVLARKKAYHEFIKLTSGRQVDEEKIGRVFRLLTGINPAKLNKEQIENRLDIIVQDEPERFFGIVTDKYLDVKAEIDEMLEYGVLRRVGNHILFNDDTIGETMEEAIRFFESKKNSDVLVVLRSQMNEKKETTEV